MRPQLLPVPLSQVCAIQAYLSRQGRPGTDQQPGQGRLATAGRADHPQHLASLQGEAKVAQGRATAARGTGTQLLDTQLALGRRQAHARRPWRVGLQQLRQALVGQARRAPLLPYRDQLVDGAEHAAH